MKTNDSVYTFAISTDRPNLRFLVQHMLEQGSANKFDGTFVIPVVTAISQQQRAYIAIEPTESEKKRKQDEEDDIPF